MDDGINADAFTRIVRFAYSGSCYLEEEEEVEEEVEEKEGKANEKLQQDMTILLAANRFGFVALGNLYERKLFNSVKGVPENAMVLKDFAQSFNFPRLERKCEKYLQNVVLPRFEGDHVGMSFPTDCMKVAGTVDARTVTVTAAQSHF
jgi:hypothetical protein